VLLAQRTAKYPKGRPETARGDAHLVQIFDVRPVSRSSVSGTHGVKVVTEYTGAGLGEALGIFGLRGWLVYGLSALIGKLDGAFATE
jgi:hypothetical protein